MFTLKWIKLWEMFTGIISDLSFLPAFSLLFSLKWFLWMSFTVESNPKCICRPVVQAGPTPLRKRKQRSDLRHFLPVRRMRWSTANGDHRRRNRNHCNNFAEHKHFRKRLFTPKDYSFARSETIYMELSKRNQKHQKQRQEVKTSKRQHKLHASRSDKPTDGHTTKAKSSAQ